MKKQTLKKISLVLQGLYLLFCFLEVVICLLYRFNWDTTLGDKCAYLALDLFGVLSFVPALPVNIIINICAVFLMRNEKKQRNKWIIWTIVSPLIYIICWMISGMVFVGTTGGV